MPRPKRQPKNTPASTTAPSAATAFKAIDQLLWKPGSGCSGALDYMEQSSWLLFLRYLDAREAERKLEAEMSGGVYEPVLPEPLRWGSWAWPAKPDGSFDADRALAGDELIAFVKNTLFPGLKALKEGETATDSVRYVVGSIFEQLACRFVNGYLLREVIQLMQPLRFRTEAERHEMSVLYEERLGAMGNAGRDGGQYYTPRPLIRAMIRLLDPKPGETFDDGACGSGGFLCEAYRHMRERSGDDPGAWKRLQKETFTGGEVKPLAYVTAQMNCILHGLETPRIAFGDTLRADVAAFSEKDRVDVIGANPPFGAGADPASVKNFTVPSSETALLFLQYFIAKLKKGGRAAVIIKNTFLSNTDNASVGVRRMLLEKCRLSWVLCLPQKVFTAGVSTVVLFFAKDGPTEKPIRYYQLDLGDVTLGKRRPLLESDLAGFEALVRGEKPLAGCAAAWEVDPAGLDPATLDLTVKNPNLVEARQPTAAERLAAIRGAYDALGRELESWRTMTQISSSLSSCLRVKLGEVCKIVLGGTPSTQNPAFWNGDIPWLTPGEMGALPSRYVSKTRRMLTSEGLEAGSRLFPARSVILSTRAPIGYVFINTVPMCTNQGCKTLIPNEHLLPEYLYFNLSGRTDELNALGTGTTFKELATGKLQVLEIPLPPLEEQRKIVERLDMALAACSRAEKLARKGAGECAGLRAALLREAFA